MITRRLLPGRPPCPGPGRGWRRRQTAHLFNASNSAGYAAQMLQGVTAVAGNVSRSTRPFTGATPAELKFRVDGVDLDTPLPDTAAALKELEDVYLRVARTRAPDAAPMMF